MHDGVSVVLVGIGGYGEVYLSALLDEPQGARCRIAGAVDPRPDSCSRLTELRSRGVPVYRTLQEFYTDSAADLAVISSPIQLHAEQMCQAVAYGSHALVEKPAAATVPDVDRMIEARDMMQSTVGVGFQWSFAPPILQLKRDITSGRFGNALTGSCLTLWPRTEVYYRRNDWAGKRRDPTGRWVLDSPANNAMAHFLHNLLFLLGGPLDRSASPVSISPRLARANDIETFDTIGARVIVRDGVNLTFLASHAIGKAEAVEPKFKFEFAKAVMDFPGGNAPVTVRCDDGTTLEYESPNATPQSQKLWNCVDAIAGISDIPCGLESARAHTQCIEGIEESGAEVLEFNEEVIKHHETEEGSLRWVPGLAAMLEQAYNDGNLPDLTSLA
ncbi:MAG: Gfo/Idh/MocA family oxidoreductase [Gemmatimonadota bacterium]|nr:MAG: Gfo/Idh/MocA family oxidoreductase [Gemmatimonadota bacterium]